MKTTRSIAEMNNIILYCQTEIDRSISEWEIAKASNPQAMVSGRVSKLRATITRLTKKIAKITAATAAA